MSLKTPESKTTVLSVKPDVPKVKVSPSMLNVKPVTRPVTFSDRLVGSTAWLRERVSVPLIPEGLFRGHKLPRLWLAPSMHLKS
jgi:hypothetical protein